MASLKTKFAVGLFLAAGLILSIFAIIWLGMSHYFEKGHRYAAYFDDSVQGLSKDSPVKYRGVPVGRVESIGVAPDARLIEVIIMFDQELAPQEHMDNIVAQLRTVGITGIMFIELDQKEKGEPDLSPKLSFKPKYPVVPTKPSEISKIFKSIDDVVKQFRALGIKDISDQVKLLLNEFSRVTKDADVKGISADIRSILAKFDRALGAAGALEKMIASGNRTMMRLEGLLARNESRIESAVRRLQAAIERADGIVRRFDTMLTDNQPLLHNTLSGFEQAAQEAGHLLRGGDGLIQHVDGQISDLQLDLLTTTQNLKRASENLNHLIELIADQPSQLFFGEPLPERPFETDAGDRP